MATRDDVVRKLAGSSGLTVREVHRFIELDAVRLEEPALPRRLRRMRRLRRDLGLSMDAVVIIVRLLDRIEALESRTTL
jgi:hypothetical protein